MGIRTKRSIFVLIVVVALAVVGLALAGFNGDPTPDEILTRVVETLDGAQTGHAVLVVEADTPDKSGRARVEVWGQKPDEDGPDAHPKFRAEVLETSEAEAEGAVAVSDGEQVWFYTPAKNKVWTGAVDALHDRERRDREPPVESPAEFVQWLQEMSEVALLDGEQVAGQDAYTLELVPRSEEMPEAAAAGAVGTMWVDQARWVPLQATLDAGSSGQARVTAESVELDVDLPADTFTFQVPDGAEVVQFEDHLPKHVTLDEAKAAVDFEVSEPANLPDAATLVDVVTVRNRVVLRYESAQGPFAISQGPGDGAADAPETSGTSVSVRGTTGTLFTDDSGSRVFLTWTEDRRTFAVSGGISAEVAQQVAESLQ